MSLTKQLYELQEVDTDIENTQRTLDLKTGQLGKREVLDNALVRLTSEKKNLEEFKHQRREAEAELEDTTSKITTTEQQLYGGRITNSKELSNLQHEINTLKNLSDQQETKTLEIIDRMEAAEKTVATATADLQKLEAEWQQQQKQLTSDIALLQKTLADLAEKRRQLTSQIEPPTLTLYDRIRQQKRQAVAKVEQGICRACRISISASILQKARSGQPVQCGTCGRILFIS
ncbi:MAG: zinc ribbon domain-containing protein [Dehalococcoidales bacterium]